MLELFTYSFIIRGLEAGLVVALIAPLIGIFLVMRRYSLIADTLAHASLAGVAVGLITGINPMITALVTAFLSSIAIEKLRISKRLYGDTALALFLSTSLAVALIILSIGHGFSVNLFSYLFGSIVTVKQSDVYIITAVGAIVILLILAFFRQLLFISFDEEAAQVAGIRTQRINLILITLAAITIALAIPIVGVLLISALLVIPVMAALQLKRSFIQTLWIAESVSVFSVLAGIISSFYLNISTSGTIVLLTVFAFCVATLLSRKK